MLEKIVETAIKAGEATLQYYNEEIEVERKDDNSPLTKADLASHHIIIDALKDIDPGTPVISEEGWIPGYEERKNWSTFWIVDPLDGTKEFLKKNGEFTVNIARIEKGEPVLGVVYAPAKSLLYYAQKQLGSFKKVDGEEAGRIYSDPADKMKPLKVIRSRSHGSGDLETNLESMNIIIKESIPAGSSLKFCYVAEGIADIYPRLGPTMEWDVAAGDCIYRNSARKGQHSSPLTYNKPDLRNEGFIIGM